MAIYRMTKEEVEKRQLLIKEETSALADFRKILKSPELLKKKLIEELEDVGKKLSAIMDDKEKEKKKVFSKGGASKPPSKTRQ
jgi:DNA gyrase subunit A